jgi:CHAT domain-containing protein
MVHYGDAVRTLKLVQRNLLALEAGSGSAAFRKTTGLLFQDFIDLLLVQADRVADPMLAQRFLVEAQDTLEGLKTAELQDYFKDECVTEFEARASRVEALAERTATLYPVLLHDRVVLLLSVGGRLQQIPAKGTRQEITESARWFRQHLASPYGEYLLYSQKLYKALIAPLDETLTRYNVDTIVFIPDGELRLVPIAALHDSQHFLVERFAVATAPGMTLYDPQPIARAGFSLLLGGLTVEREGFRRLDHVGEELTSIQHLLGGVVLKDEEFVMPALDDTLKRFPISIVHIASHAQFASDLSNTFVLTYDGHLGLNDLERLIRQLRYRDMPLELLTLSACETAVGDDRATLGLAGVAIKAGARSALASLWRIDDRASSLLVTEFYRQVRAGGASKAKALQRAQISLMRSKEYERPQFWAPFLLIGNWL